MPDEPADPRRPLVERQIWPAVLPAGYPVSPEPLAARMARYGVPGVSIAVMEKGKLVWAEGYGFADKEAEIPVTRETLFQAASISKPVAAFGALRLVADGSLHLDEDVNATLTSWRVPENEFTAVEKVTLRRLLSHEAGTSVAWFPGYGPADVLLPAVDLLEGRGNTEPVRIVFEPGTRFQYSGGGYLVAQVLMEEVVAAPFPDLMRALVLDPAGMRRSTYEQPLPAERRPEAASGYRVDGTKVAGNWHVYPEMAAAGLWTTAADLLRYARAVQVAYDGDEGALLPEDLAREMLTPARRRYGLGPRLSEDRQRFGHGGSNEGFRCFVEATLGEGNGVAVMTNSDAGSPLLSEVLVSVGLAYGWPGLRPEERPVAVLRPDHLREATGAYLAADSVSVEIVEHEGRLTIRTTLLPGPTELFPSSRLTLYGMDGTHVELLEESGRITGLVLDGYLQAGRVNRDAADR